MAESYKVVRINPVDTIKGTRELALKLMEWHGGQGTALYAVASSWYAGKAVRADLVEQAAGELRRTKQRAALSLASRLERMASRKNPTKKATKGPSVKPASKDPSILSSLHAWAKKKAAEMADAPPKQDRRLLEKYSVGDYVVFSKAPRRPLVRIYSVTDKVVKGRTFDGNEVLITAGDIKQFPVYPRRVLTAGEKIIYRQSQEFTVDEHSLADYVHAHAEGQPPRSISVPTKDITAVRGNPVRTKDGRLRTEQGRIVKGQGSRAKASKLLRMRKEAIASGEKPPARFKDGDGWLTYESAALILGRKKRAKSTSKAKSKSKAKAKAKPSASTSASASTSTSKPRSSGSREIVRRSSGGDMLDLIADSFGR